MWNAFYTNPRLTILLVLFVTVLGAMSYSGLARQEDPTLTERYAFITTFFPGATAERVEALVSEPIETKLRELAEVKELSSASKGGVSLVSVELYDSIGADEVQSIWSEVRDKLGEIAEVLPAGTVAPDLEITQSLASTLVIALNWELETPAEMGVLSRLAASLSSRLANLPGTEETEVFGEAEEELLVSLDPFRLANAGLTPQDVASGIAAADTKVSAGRLRAARTDLLIEVDAELDTPERVAGIPLVTAATGQVLRVSDLGTVEKFRVDPPSSLALHAGEPVVFVSVKMQTDLQIGPFVNNAMRVVDEFSKNLPTGISANVAYNQNDYTSARMNDLGMNLVFALVIVMLVLIWFMGLRSALTVGVALPLSGAMVLIGMQFLNIPLHQMSVSGLIISLGLLIDNAIVVVEDFRLQRKRGAEIAEGISRAVRHLIVPLGASTATTAFAFMPIALAPGGVGDFTGAVGISVVLAVTSSFILAMTVVPTLAGYLEARWPPGKGKRWWQSGFSNQRLTAWYRGSIAAVLRRPILGVAVSVVLPIIGFALAPTLTQQFFPAVDRNQFHVQLSLPAQSSIWETEEAVRTADRVLRETRGVVDTHWSVGEGAPRVYYNVTSLNDGIASYASAWVDTSSPETTLEILPNLQTELSRALPNAEVLSLPFEQGPPRDAPIEIRVVGPDLDVLRQEAEQLRRVLGSVEGVTYTRATLSTAEPKLVFVPDENATSMLGLATGDLSTRLNASLMGLRAGSVQEGNTELPVRVRLDNSSRDGVGDLATMPIVGRNGVPGSAAVSGVPLDELGRWELEPTAAAIDRRQGERLSTVQGFLVPFVLPAGVLAEFRERIDAEGRALPEGYRLEFGGEAEQSSESAGNLGATFALFGLAMIAVVTLSLNSFRHAALIFLVAFLSVGLALFGVRLFGYPFGYMALIGSLGMMGLAINGAIIVLSALKTSGVEQSGDAEQTTEVVVDATRHIVSTTATTIGGFVPLIVSGGTFWPPLATAIAGGVAGSAIIALYMVPAVFIALARRRLGRDDPETVEAVEGVRKQQPLKVSAG